MLILKIVGFIIGSILLLLVGIYCLASFRLSRVKDSFNLEERIDKQVADIIKKEQLKGLVIGVFKKGEFYIKGGGLTKEGGEIPNGKTLFEIGSIGKLFCASALQLGVAKGDFDWQDSIAVYLNSDDLMVAPTCGAKLVHLATHTSGFPRIPQLLMDQVKNMENPYMDMSIEDVYKYLSTCSENKPVGKYEYSNFGMGLLGHIQELKYGKNYEQIIKERICQPLQMKDTTITLKSDQQNNTAQPHDEKGKPTPIWKDKVLTGAGSFLSTVEDMLKFIQANLDQEHHAISPQLIACQQPQLKGEMGLGWHFGNSWMDKLMRVNGYLWHNGGTGGSCSFLAIDPTHQIGLVMFSNSAKDITSSGMWLMLLLQKHSFKIQSPHQSKVS